jgi:hypothetical protein
MRTNPLEAAILRGDELIHTPIADIELRHTLPFPVDRREIAE